MIPSLRATAVARLTASVTQETKIVRSCFSEIAVATPTFWIGIVGVELAASFAGSSFEPNSPDKIHRAAAATSAIAINLLGSGPINFLDSLAV